jgi:tRNA pseudouridine38-40 synthase
MERTLRLLLAYDGSGFHGWAAQRDPSIRTIEGVLGSRLVHVLRHPVTLSVAGRTDAGVHARGQVASLRTTARISTDRLRSAVNGGLAPEVVVREVAEAPAAFDARFSASAREYRYVIETASVPDPFTAPFVWHRPGPLHVPSMRRAAAALVGEHDFTSFCRHPGGDRSTVRDLRRLSIVRRGDRVELVLSANAFLHQMVRSLVGTLVGVGEGRIEPDRVAEILEARDRSAAKANIAPARGLTLERVVFGRRSHP